MPKLMIICSKNETIDNTGKGGKGYCNEVFNAFTNSVAYLPAIALSSIPAELCINSMPSVLSDFLSYVLPHTLEELNSFVGNLQAELWVSWFRCDLQKR